MTATVLTCTRRRMMFIAMNRFRVKKGSEEAIEQVWLSRDTQLTKVPGFVEFHLLKGPEHEDYTLYSSHTVWQSKGDLRGLDQVGSIPSCPSGRRPEQAALPRPSAVRRLRGPPDGASRRRCGRVERLPSVGVRKAAGLRVPNDPPFQVSTPGRAAVVLPDVSLFGEGVKTRLKEHLMEECNLHTIVRLPNSVFKPYASIGTNLLFFEKGEPTKEIWFYEHRVPEDQKAYSMTKPIRVEHLKPCVDWWGGAKRKGRVETEV